MDTGAQFAFSFYLAQDPSPQEVLPISRVGLPISSNQISLSLTHGHWFVA